MQKVLTLDEVAEILKVHPETVRDWLRSGKIQGFKPGGGKEWRVLEEDLEAYVKRLRDEQKPSK